MGGARPDLTRTAPGSVISMAQASQSSVSFGEADTRDDAMHSTIERWIDELVERVDEAQASAEF